MVEMFQTAIWDEVLAAYQKTLVGTNNYRAVPYDIQVKVGDFTEIKPDGKTVIGWEGTQDLFTTGQFPPVMNDGCYFGAIVEAENDRFFAWNTSGEKPVFEEIDNDDVFLLDTHIIIYDNAVDGNGDACPNIYKNKKPYKELNLPIMLKASNADTFPIVYTVHIIVKIPTDAAGHVITTDYDWDTPEKEELESFAKIIMPAIIFMKPDCVQSPPTPETGACPTGIGALGTG